MPPTCDHPTPGGRCQRSVPDDESRCFMHDESGAPSTHGAPTGNSNAVGNSGGGAPPRNANAWKHGAFCDTELLGERLGGDARNHAEELAESILERAAETVPEIEESERERLAWRYAVLNHQWHLASADTFKRGFGYDRETTVETDDGETVTFTYPDVNPTVVQGLRIDARLHRIWDKLNLSP